ncbi:MAG: cytochrome c maturation protein CcmE [Legionellales bacterium]|nr:cytochrome c maturation protein CcmE [Legionellales bacterium]
MHPVRRRKLSVIILVLVILALACGLVLYALRQNISLFYTPSQIIAGTVPKQHVIRVGGMVVKGSILRHANGLDVTFQLTDYAQTIQVKYHGILPDLFREEQGVVAQGLLQKNSTFRATQVLAKHDENYMPPEVKASLQPQFSAKFKS